MKDFNSAAMMSSQNIITTEGSDEYLSTEAPTLEQAYKLLTCSSGIESFAMVQNLSNVKTSQDSTSTFVDNLRPIQQNNKNISCNAEDQSCILQDYSIQTHLALTQVAHVIEPENISPNERFAETQCFIPNGSNLDI